MPDVRTAGAAVDTIQRAPVLEVELVNHGKYCEGALISAPLSFPTTQEQVQAALKRIGVDGLRYETVRIESIASSVDGLHNRIGEWAHIDELNHLAHLIKGLDEWEAEKLGAVLELEYCGDTKKLINIVENLDSYDLYGEVHTESDLGWYYIEECGGMEIPEHIQPYFDYEAYGRDCHLDEISCFTKHGYVRSDNSFTEYYHSREDIPDEHKVFAYPVPDALKKQQARQQRPEPERSR